MTPPGVVPSATASAGGGDGATRRSRSTSTVGGRVAGGKPGRAGSAGCVGLLPSLEPATGILGGDRGCCPVPPDAGGCASASITKAAATAVGEVAAGGSVGGKLGRPPGGAPSAPTRDDDSPAVDGGVGMPRLPEKAGATPRGGTTGEDDAWAPGVAGPSSVAGGVGAPTFVVAAATADGAAEGAPAPLAETPALPDEGDSRGTVDAGSGCWGEGEVSAAAAERPNSSAAAAGEGASVNAGSSASFSVRSPVRRAKSSASASSSDPPSGAPPPPCPPHISAMAVASEQPVTPPPASAGSPPRSTVPEIRRPPAAAASPPFVATPPLTDPNGWSMAEASMRLARIVATGRYGSGSRSVAAARQRRPATAPEAASAGAAETAAASVGPISDVAARAPTTIESDPRVVAQRVGPTVPARSTAVSSGTVAPAGVAAPVMDGLANSVAVSPSPAAADAAAAAPASSLALPLLLRCNALPFSSSSSGNTSVGSRPGKDGRGARVEPSPRLRLPPRLLSRAAARAAARPPPNAVSGGRAAAPVPVAGPSSSPEPPSDPPPGSPQLVPPLPVQRSPLAPLPLPSEEAGRVMSASRAANGVLTTALSSMSGGRGGCVAPMPSPPPRPTPPALAAPPQPPAKAPPTSGESPSSAEAARAAATAPSPPPSGTPPSDKASRTRLPSGSAAPLPAGASRSIAARRRLRRAAPPPPPGPPPPSSAARANGSSPPPAVVAAVVAVAAAVPMRAAFPVGSAASAVLPDAARRCNPDMTADDSATSIPTLRVYTRASPHSSVADRRSASGASGSLTAPARRTMDADATHRRGRRDSPRVPATHTCARGPARVSTRSE